MADIPEDTNIRVAVRCRPFNTREKANSEVSCARLTTEQVVLTNPQTGEEFNFGFDVIFDQDSFQHQVWQCIGVPILTKAFNGYNATIFAYGQTGSGKTWSMQGGNDDLQGIIPRMNTSLFDKIESEKSSRPSSEFLVTVSYFEIYNEIIFDLLDVDRKKNGANKGGLEIKEHPVLGVYVKGLQEIVVDTPAKLQSIIDQGMGSRTVASTQMNADSSRSHSVFTIMLHQKDRDDKTKNVFAKVNLVDLAGSERVKSTGASGATLKEGANINKSLSELGNVINALVEMSKGKKVFIPYRNSKLTRVLQESLGGNSITAMLAAMSPAACNFDETLSTLKYANRAKAIKVKAIKNEEASQVSRLNDEIRMLREKLQGNVQSVDTGAMEERHRQQLRDLEEAMKSTWDAKSKVSAEYETERRRLEAEQRAASRQLEISRERNWKLLEDKGDLELSLAHVRGLVRKSSPHLSGKLSAWLTSLRDLVRAEQRLSEQDTVVQVYRTSLEKDVANLVRPANAKDGKDVTPAKWDTFGTPRNTGDWSSMMNNSESMAGALVTAPHDKTTLSMWRQLKDKYDMIRSEVVQWTTLQENLKRALSDFLVEVSEAQQTHRQDSAGEVNIAINNSNDVPETTGSLPEDSEEISRGLLLLSRQVVTKKYRCDQNISLMRANLTNFYQVSGDLEKSLLSYYVATEQASCSLSACDAAALTVAMTEQQRLIQDELKNCSDKLIKTFVAPISPQLLRMHSGREPKPPKQSLGGEEQVSKWRLSECSAGTCCSDTSGAVTGWQNAQPIIDGKLSWHCDASSSVKTHVGHHLEVAFPVRRKVTGLVLQGGYAGRLRLSDATEPSSAPVTDAPLTPATICLPCGLTLSECSGNADMTAEALGQVFSWETLLKKNSPDKFLKRPPVRFLFDLFRFVGEANTGLFPESIVTAEWDAVSLNKQTKTDFMNEIIESISKYLSIASVTSANNIVTGAEPDLTNTFLQQLAIAIYYHQHHKALEVAHTASTAAPHKPKLVKKASVREMAVSSWPLSVRVCLSSDGEEWERDEVFADLDMSSESTSTTIKFAGEPVEAKYIRIFPLKWASGPSVGGLEASGGPALRVAVRALTEEGASTLLQADTLTITGLDDVTAVLNLLQDATTATISAIQYISKMDDMFKTRKQDEVRKHVEGLANEKQALEQLLVNEKQVLHNEKQDLAHQLSDCLQQLADTQHLCDKEQAHKLQLESHLQIVETEKTSVQANLQAQMDENSLLRSELLKMQVNFERDRVLIEGLQKTVSDQEQVVSRLTAEAEDFAQKKCHWDTEKDDWHNQIEVLTEERDAARLEEEDLFEKLADRTQDLERLQESYVDMSDRYNDSQDEVADLREKLESLKELTSERFSAAKKTSSGNLHSSGRSFTSDDNNSQSSTVNSSNNHSMVDEGLPPVTRSLITAPEQQQDTPTTTISSKISPAPLRANSSTMAPDGGEYDDDFDDYEFEEEN